MSLRLLLDEDSQDHELVRLLRSSGHDVSTVNELALRRADDKTILQRAHLDDRVLLTYNVDDFRELHDSNTPHSGIAVICRDDDPSKDMSIADIARALGNIGSTAWDISGEFIILNHWQY